MNVEPTPRELFPGLFDYVQSGQIFPDSKTFVDAVPRSAPQAINAEFERCRKQAGFDVRAFVDRHFQLPPATIQTAGYDRREPIYKAIETLWGYLRRDADEKVENSSLIPLPHPYIVPGGRFREIYYWDSYFTMLGLAEAGHTELVRDMVDNFAYLVDAVGFIPNGNRNYFCTRSQPPYFSLMVELLDSLPGHSGVSTRYQQQLLREYGFWMSGADELAGRNGAHRRVVAVDGAFLNRYWDDATEPRQESYAEDLVLAATAGRSCAGLYRDLRAAAESGWDFSSRWLDDRWSLASIRTTRIVPVDLNSLMFNLERLIATNFDSLGDRRSAANFHDKAARRKELLRSIFFDARSGLFVDLEWPAFSPSPRRSIATAYPLSFGIATANQADQVARQLEKDFLAAGGWLTTLEESDQQWDKPNGWAPMQWTVFEALRRYGFDSLAREGARRWVQNVTRVYEQTGRLREKYNVVDVGEVAAGGEYEVQDGFGWTNAIQLCLQRYLQESN